MSNMNNNLLHGAQNAEHSGAPLGHWIPASCFLGYGAFFLYLTFKRVKELRPSGVSYCEAHVPEKNLSLIRRLGIGLLSLATAGILYEGFGGVLEGYTFFQKSLHMTLYACFGFVGLVGLLEGKERLPPDSGRATTAIALILEAFLWNQHASGKISVDGKLHVVLAQICFVGGAAMVFSVWQPSSMIGYLAGWSLLVLQALWLIMAGFFAGGMQLSMHQIGIALSWQTLFVSLVVVIGAAIATGPPEEGNRPTTLSQFSKLDQNDPDDDSEEQHEPIV